MPDGFKVKIPCRKFGRNVHAAGTALRDVSFDWCCNCCFCCLLFLHMHYGMAFSIVVIVNCCHCQLLAFSIVVIVFSFTKMLFILPLVMISLLKMLICRKDVIVISVIVVVVAE